MFLVLLHPYFASHAGMRLPRLLVSAAPLLLLAAALAPSLSAAQSLTNTCPDAAPKPFAQFGIGNTDLKPGWDSGEGERLRNL